MTCPITVTRDEWLWLRGIKCGDPIDRDGLCTRHADDRDRLGEVSGMGAHLSVVRSEEAS
jgi:hypothetical protein